MAYRKKLKVDDADLLGIESVLTVSKAETCGKRPQSEAVGKEWPIIPEALSAPGAPGLRLL